MADIMLAGYPICTLNGKKVQYRSLEISNDSRQKSELTLLDGNVIHVWACMKVLPRSKRAGRRWYELDCYTTKYLRDKALKGNVA